jgi:hypothetical protein
VGDPAVAEGLGLGLVLGDARPGDGLVLGCLAGVGAGLVRCAAGWSCRAGLGAAGEVAAGDDVPAEPVASDTGRTIT